MINAISMSSHIFNHVLNINMEHGENENQRKPSKLFLCKPLDGVTETSRRNSWCVGSGLAMDGHDFFHFLFTFYFFGKGMVIKWRWKCGGEMLFIYVF